MLAENAIPRRSIVWLYREETPVNRKDAYRKCYTENAIPRVLYQEDAYRECYSEKAGGRGGNFFLND